ncbi:hypothetical protein GCM10009592_11720 [Brachybacterium rhamnosum]
MLAQRTTPVRTVISTSAAAAARYGPEKTNEDADTASSRLIARTNPVKKHCFAATPPLAEANRPSHPASSLSPLMGLNMTGHARHGGQPARGAAESALAAVTRMLAPGGPAPRPHTEVRCASGPGVPGSSGRR